MKRSGRHGRPVIFHGSLLTVRCRIQRQDSVYPSPLRRRWQATYLAAIPLEYRYAGRKVSCAGRVSSCPCRSSQQTCGYQFIQPHQRGFKACDIAGGTARWPASVQCFGQTRPGNPITGKIGFCQTPVINRHAVTWDSDKSPSRVRDRMLRRPGQRYSVSPSTFTEPRTGCYHVSGCARPPVHIPKA